MNFDGSLDAIDLNNPLKARKYQIKQLLIQDEKILSEGGYGYVWKARDLQNGQYYAVKKMICKGEERQKTAYNELEIFKKLPLNKNVIRFYAGEVYKRGEDCVAIFVMEFCEGGSLFDLMTKYEKSKLSEKQVVYIIKEIAQGLIDFHSLGITHRDIKIENVLLHNKAFKICDFGSCSTQDVDFKKISRQDYCVYEEIFEKNTTLMYRPPEMCDPYQQMLVNQKVDSWMLGCVAYTLLFYKHPFQETSKLAIVNASFIIPQEHNYSSKMIDFVRHMLTPNPQFRPSASEIYQIAENYESISSINLNEQAQQLKLQKSKQDSSLDQYMNKKLKNFDLDQDIPIHELQKLQNRIQNNEVDDRPKKKPVKNQIKDNDFSNFNFVSDQSNQFNHQSSNKNGFDDFSQFGQFQQPLQQQNQDFFSQFQDSSCKIKQTPQEVDLIGMDDSQTKSKTTYNDLSQLEFF